jgi:hypothetical protein
MADKKDLLRELAKLETLIFQIERVIKSDDEKRFGDLVELRRTLAIQTGISNEAALSYPRLMNDPEASAIFRNKLSALRALNADHQAKWPASAVARDPEGFAKSANHVQAMAYELFMWVKGAIAKYPD